MHIVKCAQPAGRLRKAELSMKEGFLEIKELKKSFGTGEARQEVLKGMNFTVPKQ